MSWQKRETAGIQEAALLGALNRELSLSRAPEYMRFRPRELREARMFVWMNVPELSTGRDRRERGKETPGPIFASPMMSPMEAYLAADWLIYQKLVNDDFVLTDAEAVKANPSAKVALAPGIHARNANPRRIEFERHIHQVATAKWRSVDDVVDAINSILGGKQ